MGSKLTSRKTDYSKWYNEIVINADLAENSAVRGCMIIKPYGYACLLYTSPSPRDS